MKCSPAAYGWPLREKAATLAGYSRNRGSVPASERANPAGRSMPPLARRSAGETSAAHELLPYFRCASAKPATVPGTPTDLRLPWWIRAEYAPVESVNIVGVAACGAISRKSNVVARPSGKRTTMKPPPPMLPAAG